MAEPQGERGWAWVLKPEGIKKKMRWAKALALESINENKGWAWEFWYWKALQRIWVDLGLGTRTTHCTE